MINLNLRTRIFVTLLTGRTYEITTRSAQNLSPWNTKPVNACPAAKCSPAPHGYIRLFPTMLRQYIAGHAKFKIR